MALNEDGLYNWVKSTPVYFKEIESIIDPIRKRNKLNSIKEKEKFTQEEAIAFLKELGYKIMKPVTEFVEI